jgi:N-acetylglutamate synthase-like GNAT family acetyltransferase
MNGRNCSEPVVEPLQIRTARSTDKDSVSALLDASYSYLLAGSYDRGILSLALPYMVKANPTLLASGTYYVAETRPSILIGCGGWTAAKPGCEETIEGEAHIRHFAIHPEWTRRGIGRALLARCISDVRSIGVRRLHCFSTLNAEPFYRASGFQTIGLIEVPMGPTVAFPAVLMQCELP